jgi:SAM-dependent methyltransferase
LDRVGIQPGERMLELGPGPGAFTIEAARRVEPGSSLVAVDIQSGMIAIVEKRVGEAGLTNVETHVASAHDLPLEDASVDRAFLVTVLPEIPGRQRALAELRRVLKPGGVLSITEEFLDPDYPLAWMTIRWAEEAGFEFAERHGTTGGSTRSTSRNWRDDALDADSPGSGSDRSTGGFRRHPGGLEASHQRESQEETHRGASPGGAVGRGGDATLPSDTFCPRNRDRLFPRRPERGLHRLLRADRTLPAEVIQMEKVTNSETWLLMHNVD